MSIIDSFLAKLLITDREYALLKVSIVDSFLVRPLVTDREYALLKVFITESFLVRPLIQDREYALLKVSITEFSGKTTDPRQRICSTESVLVDSFLVRQVST